MNPRPRRLLPALVLASGVLVLTLSVLGVGVLRSEPGHAATSLGKPRPRAVQRRHRVKPLGERAAKVALRAVGVPYRWGGTSLSGGFDCSGLVYWAYAKLGIEVPHNSYALNSTGRMASLAHMKPGDVLVFSGLGHVGLYLGSGRMVHAPQTGEDVEIVRLRGSRYGQRLVGARRIAPA